MNELVLRLLRSRHLRWLLGRSLIGLRVRGRRSGRVYTFPVQYASSDDGLVVMPGMPEIKTWWRNLRTPSPVQLLRNGRWSEAEAQVFLPTDAAYPRLRDAYRARWAGTEPAADQPLVRIRPC